VLVEGHVAILPVSVPPTVLALRSAVTLEPGDRLEFENPQLAVKSVARIDREEAWLAGHVVFNSTRLSAALEEMNRYASRRLELADPALGEVRVSGTFSAGDSDAFARAVAQMFSLTINDTPEAIVLRPRSR
jgi:transmembrane sensor